MPSIKKNSIFISFFCKFILKSLFIGQVIKQPYKNLFVLVLELKYIYLFFNGINKSKGI